MKIPRNEWINHPFEELIQQAGHRVEYKVKEGKYEDAFRWAESNLKSLVFGGWCSWTGAVFIFEDPDEAMLFKLIWVGV